MAYLRVGIGMQTVYLTSQGNNSKFLNKYATDSKPLIYKELEVLFMNEKDGQNGLK